LADVEFYYQSKLEEESGKLAELAKTDSTVKSYFEEIERLKAEYQQLQTDLYTSGAHDRVIEAMIENFRIRLRILEQLEKRKQAFDKDGDKLSYRCNELKKHIRSVPNERIDAMKTGEKAIWKSFKQNQTTKQQTYNTHLS
jgi:hypothetical protein